MKKIFSLVLISMFLLVVVIPQLQCSSNNEKKTMTKEEQIAKGKYLVNLGGCNDCHSPKIMTAMGPVPDTTRLLSGHPGGEELAEFDPGMVAPGKWYLGSADMTAWVGPWGISYTANLTPDQETGLGAWTPEVFIKALRTGKHMGVGRQLLPPMPWEPIGHLTNEDLTYIFEYLHSLPAIKNKVPAPVPPNMLKSFGKKVMKNGKKEMKNMKDM